VLDPIVAALDEPPALHRLPHTPAFSRTLRTADAFATVIADGPSRGELPISEAGRILKVPPDFIAKTVL
jgi:hypothetical protein